MPVTSTAVCFMLPRTLSRRCEEFNCRADGIASWRDPRALRFQGVGYRVAAVGGGERSSAPHLRAALRPAGRRVTCLGPSSGRRIRGRPVEVG